MLSLAKRVMSMYMPLVAKMVEDNPFLMVAMDYFELLCDVNLLVFLSCLLPMLEIIHPLIKFVQKWDVFVCDYVATIKICQGQLNSHYSNLDTKYVLDVFKEFLDLVDYTHNIVHLKWKANSLDLNTLGVEYLCFESLGYSFWVTCLNDHGENIQISREIYSSLVDVAKSSCSCFYLQIILWFNLGMFFNSKHWNGIFV
jgi:hypothetical protein